MGNCQAIDNATVVIQQPSGRVDKLYSPVPATDIMKMNPGHYVALLLTTTSYPSTAATNANEPLRITRIKLLRPTDTLVLGHTYRLISAQEVMKGLWARKYAKMQKKQSESSGGREEKTSSDLHTAAATRSYELEKKPKQVIKHDRHRPRASSSTNSASSSSTTAKSRGWHPSLQSISEARS